MIGHKALLNGDGVAVQLLGFGVATLLASNLPDCKWRREFRGVPDRARDVR